ncbi:MAG: hypothetical protein P9M14_15815 [Candidatus Alcyoniella australis]|nr:hypothetical protein [Candidatus Alcyoniella australis]
MYERLLELIEQYLGLEPVLLMHMVSTLGVIVLYLLVRKPFVVGDRIQIGDSIPNGWVFKQPVANYTQGLARPAAYTAVWRA